VAGWLLSEAEDEVNWTGVAPCGEFREAGTATTAPENRGDRPGVARHGCHFGAQSRAAIGGGEKANAFRTVGRTAKIYKLPMAARLCAPRWHGVGQRRQQRSIVERRSDGKVDKPGDVRAMPNVATLSRHRTGKREVAGGRDDVAEHTR